MSPWEAAGRRPADVGLELYHLAMRYWSEERPQDALRVAGEAKRLLEQASPPSPLLADVASALRSIEREVGNPT